MLQIIISIHGVHLYAHADSCDKVNFQNYMLVVTEM